MIEENGRNVTYGYTASVNKAFRETVALYVKSLSLVIDEKLAGEGPQKMR
jgi:hypothetical protein